MLTDTRDHSFLNSDELEEGETYNLVDNRSPRGFNVKYVDEGLHYLKEQDGFLHFTKHGKNIFISIKSRPQFHKQKRQEQMRGFSRRGGRSRTRKSTRRKTRRRKTRRRRR